MKNIFIKFNMALVILFIFISKCMAFEYSDNDKNMFYDAFIDGYIAEITKSVEKQDISQSKKQKSINAIKQQINKQELIDSSWECIKTYPIDKIIAASVICTAEWSKNQNKKIKSVLEHLE